MTTLGRLSWRALFALVLGLVVFSAMPAQADDRPPAVDTWVKVAERGLADVTPGAPMRGVADAVAIHRGYVYVGAHSETSVHVFRASLVDDRNWEDVTPPQWSGSSGSIVGMVTYGGELYVAGSSASIARRRADGQWERITRGAIYSIGVWQSPSGAQLCFVRPRRSEAFGLSVECGSTPRPSTDVVSWTHTLPDHPLAQSTEVAGAVLGQLGGRLYVGLSGDTANSSFRCALHSTDGVAWRTVTDTCFGQENLPWLNSLQEFDGWLYIGTGGHFGSPRVLRTHVAGNEDVYEDITPFALYPWYNDPAALGAPARYGSVTASSTRLFFGTRTGGAGVWGDVVTRYSDGSWHFSNNQGFDGTNDTISAMGSDGYYVYAGTIDLNHGFQVWRRQTSLQRTNDYIRPLIRKVPLLPRVPGQVIGVVPLCPKPVCPPPCIGPAVLCPSDLPIIRQGDLIGVGLSPYDVGRRGIAS